MKNFDNQLVDNNQPVVARQEANCAGEYAAGTVQKFDYSLLRARVNEIIDRGLNDMWLLIDGEEMDMDYQSGLWRDGRAFAMVNGGQVALLGPRFAAVNALLSVGIMMH